MALIDKASLLFVPSVVAEGKAFNVLPSGNRAPDNKGGAGYDQTRADFDFDRGSNTAATRVNADGLIEKYRENKIIYSNLFTTGWSLYKASVTSGHTGYDSGDAFKLIANTETTYHEIKQNLSLSGVQTFSVYVKADGFNYVLLYANGFGGGQFFNLTNGTTASTLGASLIHSEIVDAENGWYRCSITFNASNTSCVIQTSATGTTNTHAGDGVSGILIQNAQAETGLVATEVLTSGATTAKAGVLVDLPRINYDANGENGSLLLEPSRANLVQFSEYFSTASGYWINVRSTIETNSTTSPEGLNNASKILQDSTTTNAGVIVKSITASGSNTFSFFAKKGSVNFARLSLNSGTETSAYFDLENGEVGTTNSISESDCFIEDMGNDWYRCGATYSGATNRFNIYLGDRDGITTLLDASNAYIYIYGAQWEASASYPSSYIPNHGESGGVTRAADSCSVTGASDVIGQTEGTMFAEFEIDADNTNGYNRVLAVGDGTSSNRIIMFAHYTERFRFYVASGGVAQVDMTTSTAVLGAKHKIAFAYKTNDFVAYVDGVQVGTDTSGTIPACPNVYLGTNEEGAAQNLEGDVQQATLFNERLSNAELATLTTL